MAIWFGIAAMDPVGGTRQEDPRKNLQVHADVNRLPASTSLFKGPHTITNDVLKQWPE